MLVRYKSVTHCPLDLLDLETNVLQIDVLPEEVIQNEIASGESFGIKTEEKKLDTKVSGETFGAQAESSEIALASQDVAVESHVGVQSENSSFSNLVLKQNLLKEITPPVPQATESVVVKTSLIPDDKEQIFLSNSDMQMSFIKNLDSV